MKFLFNNFLFLTLILTQRCTNNINHKNMKYKLNFDTQYSQFYIEDKEIKTEINPSEFWSEEAHLDGLAMENGIVGVRTECYGPVKGELIILKKANNDINFDLYDHIVEGRLNVKSGIIQVLDCPNRSVELEISIESGFYRIRVYSSNLSSVVGDEGDDYYKIEIWKDDNLERKVLKRYVRK